VTKQPQIQNTIPTLVNYLIARLDSPSHTLSIKQHLVDALVQHKGASVNRTEAGEALRQTAQAVERVVVGTLEVEALYNAI
jgi:hypothetical protein